MAPTLDVAALSKIWTIDSDSVVDFFNCDEKLFACCTNGIYGLDVSPEIMDIDYDEMFDVGPATKAQCVDLEALKRPIHAAKLCVKFKRPAKCFAMSENVIFSLHEVTKLSSRHSQMYIEATNLATFQCVNPNVHSIDDLCDENVALVDFTRKNCDNVCLVVAGVGGQSKVHFLTLNKAENFRVIDRKSLTKPRIELLVEAAKIDEGDTYEDDDNEDLVEKILRKMGLDEKEIECENNCLVVGDICDIVKVSARIVFVLLKNGRLVQFTRTGKKLVRVEIDAFGDNVMRVRRLGRSRCDVLCRNGSVYRCSVPFDKKSKGEGQPRGLCAVRKILEASEEMRKLASKQARLETLANQLKLALDFDPTNFDTSFRVHSKNRLEIEISNKACSTVVLCGSVWRLYVTFGSAHYTFDLSFVLKPGTKWKINAEIPEDLSTVEALPLVLAGCFVLRINGQYMRCQPIFQYEVDTLDVVAVTSEVVSASCVETAFEVHCDDESLSFEDFVDNLNRETVWQTDGEQGEGSCAMSTKTVTVVVKKVAEGKLAKLLATLTNFSCVSMFGENLSIHTKAVDGDKVEVALKSRNVDTLLKLKSDILKASIEKRESLPIKVPRRQRIAGEEMACVLTSMGRDESQKGRREVLRSCYEYVRRNCYF